MDASDSPLLSVRQRHIVAAGATALAMTVLLLAVFGAFRLLQIFVATFQHVLLPLAIAAILATLLRPFVTFFEERTRLTRVQSIVLLYASVVLAGVFLAGMVVPVALVQARDAIEQTPRIWQNMLETLRTSAPALWEWLKGQLGQSPEAYFQSLLSENAGLVQAAVERARSTFGSIGAFMADFAGNVAAYAVVPVYLFFILDSNRNVWLDLDKQLSFIREDRREDIVFLVRQFSEILVSFFRGQIIIGLILGVFLAAGFSIAGLKFGIIVGMAAGILNIVPYLGVILGILTVLPLAYFQDGGGLDLLVSCGIIFTVGQLAVDYYLVPRIMGDRTGMSPMLIIFSIFFWGTALNGILGMILAIPLTASVLVFWRLAREKYLPDPGADAPPAAGAESGA